MEEKTQGKTPYVYVKSLPDKSLDILLDTMKIEYEQDIARNAAIETKTGIAVSADFAALALIMPNLPFSGIKEVFLEGYTPAVMLVTLGLTGLTSSLILLIYSLTQFFRALFGRKFGHVNIHKVYQFGHEDDNEVATKKGLIEHYYEIVTLNRETVEGKMASFNIGLKTAVVAAPILVASFIIISFVA